MTQELDRPKIDQSGVELVGFNKIPMGTTVFFHLALGAHFATRIEGRIQERGEGQFLVEINDNDLHTKSAFVAFNRCNVARVEKSNQGLQIIIRY